MSGRTVDTAEVRDLAAAVASVASVKTHAASASGAESGGQQETPTPWDMIGDWEIGDTIHEQA
jgi:hypothetical protein